MRVDPSQVSQVKAAAAEPRRARPASAMSFDAQLQHAAGRPVAPAPAGASSPPKAPATAPKPDAQLEHATLRAGGVAAPSPAAPSTETPATTEKRAAGPQRAPEQQESAEIAQRHDIKGPKRETYARVPGRSDYVEITSGPRNGMFVNVSGNERDGQAFVRVKRGHHMLHIYGRGEDRVVIAQRRPATSYKPADGAPKNETYADVSNHWEYDEIMSGPRNGMFINRSGNPRDGLAFVRVERGDRVFHVYGKGKDRLMIEVHGHWKPAPELPGPRAHLPNLER